jgi:hypothetical protein
LIDRGAFHEEVSFTDHDFCGQKGLNVQVEGTVSGREMATTHGGELIYFQSHEMIDVTQTAHGVTTRFVQHALFKDLKVTDNGDGTLTIIVLGTGPSTLYGPDGKAIARDPGQVRFEMVIDHAGTPTDPEDDEEISFELIKESTGRNDDFCTAELALRN